MQTFIIEVFDDMTCLKEDISAMLSDIYNENDIILSHDDWKGHVAYALGSLIFALTHTDGMSYHQLVADMLKFYRSNLKMKNQQPRYDQVTEYVELLLAMPAAISVQRRLKTAIGNYLHDRASIETEISITHRRLIVRVDT